MRYGIAKKASSNEAIIAKCGSSAPSSRGAFILSSEIPTSGARRAGVTVFWHLTVNIIGEVNITRRLFICDDGNESIYCLACENNAGKSWATFDKPMRRFPGGDDNINVSQIKMSKRREAAQCGKICRHMPLPVYAVYVNAILARINMNSSLYEMNQSTNVIHTCNFPILLRLVDSKNQICSRFIMCNP